MALVRGTCFRSDNQRPDDSPVGIEEFRARFGIRIRRSKHRFQIDTSFSAARILPLSVRLRSRCTRARIPWTLHATSRRPLHQPFAKTGKSRSGLWPGAALVRRLVVVDLSLPSLRWFAGFGSFPGTPARPGCHRSSKEERGTGRARCRHRSGPRSPGRSRSAADQSPGGS